MKTGEKMWASVATQKADEASLVTMEAEAPLARFGERLVALLATLKECEVSPWSWTLGQPPRRAEEKMVAPMVASGAKEAQVKPGEVLNSALSVSFQADMKQ